MAPSHFTGGRNSVSFFGAQLLDFFSLFAILPPSFSPFSLANTTSQNIVVKYASLASLPLPYFYWCYTLSSGYFRKRKKKILCALREQIPLVLCMRTLRCTV